MEKKWWGNFIMIRNPPLFFQNFALMITLLTPIVFIVYNLPGVAHYLTNDTPPAQLLYVFSKAMGLVSISIIVFQVFVGLSHSAVAAPLKRLIDVPLNWHSKLGGALCASILTHCLCFAAANSLRTGQVAWQLLLPTFSQGYYKSAISIGAIALYLLIFAVCTRFLSIIPAHLQRLFHRFALLGATFSIVHAWLIGSEFRQLLVWMLVAAGISVGVFLAKRIFKEVYD